MTHEGLYELYTMEGPGFKGIKKERRELKGGRVQKKITKERGNKRNSQDYWVWRILYAEERRRGQGSCKEWGS